MEFKDYYQIMGVKRDATQDEVKRAYRKLARKYHPDVSKEADAEVRFKEVGEAYEVLKDPEKRAAYDQLGANWKAGQDFRPPPDWDAGFEFHGGGFSGADASRFSDFFESLFGHGFTAGGGGHAAYHARGEDAHAKVLIDLEDAYQGAARTLTLQHTELGADGRPQVKQRTLHARIPRGVRQGQFIRLAGQGLPRGGLGRVPGSARDTMGGGPGCDGQGADAHGCGGSQDTCGFRGWPQAAAERPRHTGRDAGRLLRGTADCTAAGGLGCRQNRLP